MRVALLSAAPPGSLGSMAIYADLVKRCVERVAPEIELISVPVLHNEPKGSLSRLAAIGSARWRSSQVEADVFHWLDGSHAYLAGAIPWERTLITVHDFIPALQAAGDFPGIKPPGWAGQSLFASSLRAIRRAGAVCAVSQSTADDARRFTGRQVDAVVPLCLRPLPPHSQPAVLLPRPYILHVGHSGFYKNREAVLAVFTSLAATDPKLHLVLAGAPASAQDVSRTQAAGFSERVHWLDMPSDAELSQLYGQAELLLFPSLYEGFGWPTLEAMAYHCPVVCSTTGSLPEVVGSGAFTCYPTDIQAMAWAITRLRQEPQLRSALVKHGVANLRRFSTEAMGQGLVSLYAQLHSSIAVRPNAG